MPDEDGITRLEKNENFGASDLTKPEPKVPSEIGYLLDWFWDLNNNRSNNGFGLMSVSWFEFEAWRRVTGNLVSGDEAYILMRLFRVYDVALEENAPKE